MRKINNKKISILALIFVAIFYAAILFPRSSSAVRVAPKRANYYLNWEILDNKITELAKWDLLILDMETQINSLSALKKIKQLNPDIILLAYITPQEIKKDADVGASIMRRKLAAGLDQSWYLTDTQNNKITFWSGTWMLNVADNAPEINGVKLNQYMAKFVAKEILSAGVWDGIFYDNAWKDVKWLAGDTVDLNKDGQKDSDIDRHWREGMRAIYQETRKLTNNKFILLGNATSDVYKDDLNGIMLENWPPLGWKDSMNIYAGNQQGVPLPRVNIINANTANLGGQNAFKEFRFGLASALLLDGHYAFDFGDTAHAQTWWYDEYDVELGKPLGVALSVNGKERFAEDVWRREYENGLALVNATASAQNIDLGGEYEKIQGRQDNAVNNGAIVSQVKLNPKDGLIMLRTFSALKNAVFANGSFVGFFDINGKRVRNGLFAYEEGAPGGAKIYRGDLNGDGAEEKITVTGPRLEIFDNQGNRWFNEFPFSSDYKGGIRIAVGKLFNTEENYIIAAQSAGGQAVIYNYHGALVRNNFMALGKKYKAGLAVTIARDAKQNQRVVAGTDGGQRPEAIVFDNNFSKIIKRFFINNKKLKSGLSLAAGDFNGDGADELAAAFSSGKEKVISIFSMSGKKLSQFKIPATGFNAGAVSLAAADVNFDGKDDIILLSGGQ